MRSCGLLFTVSVGLCVLLLSQQGLYEAFGHDSDKPFECSSIAGGAIREFDREDLG